MTGQEGAAPETCQEGGAGDAGVHVCAAAATSVTRPASICLSAGGNQSDVEAAYLWGQFIANNSAGLCNVVR